MLAGPRMSLYCSQEWKDNGKRQTTHYQGDLRCQLQLLPHQVTEDFEWDAIWKELDVLCNSQQVQGSMYHVPIE